jgi:uncharacterized protein
MGAPVVHFEIGCKDSEKAQAFYGGLFGWTFSAYGPAAMISTGSEMGINGHINSLGHEPHNYVTVYGMVEDLEASIRMAEELGGKSLVPPTEVPGMGAFAWVADPEGNIVGLWKVMRQE